VAAEAAAGLPPAILLMGPTASGKTDLAVWLTRRFPVDIVSVDSAMVYRGMDIGTAKPEPSLLTEAPHRLIDICDPSEAYSAARFRDDALHEMASIARAGRVPLLVGGTMLYFRTLQQGLADLPQADDAVRERLREELERIGLAAMHQRLARRDPLTAARIHPNDPQRTLRALEVIELTGRPFSSILAEETESRLPYRLAKLVLAPADRSELHDRIGQRFRAMLALGFEAEVRALLERPDLRPELPSMRAVGYRQMAGYLQGEYDHAEMIERAVAATRQLAKRQFTWLRREQDCLWLSERRAPEQAAGCIESLLSETNTIDS